MRLWPTGFSFSSASCKTVLGGSAWAMVGAFASAIFRQIDYLLLGLIAPVGIVGIYFFAYQLSMQPGLLLSQNIRRVFVPAFAAAGDDASRQRRAVIHTASFLGLVVSPLILYFALVCDGVELLLWRGRWAAAVPAIRFLSAAVPIHLFSLFSRILIESAGKFRIWSLGMALRGVCIGIAVLVSALLGGRESAAVVAACVAVMIAVSGLVEAMTMLHILRMPATAALRAFLAPYTLAAMAALIAASLPRWAGPVSEPYRLAAISLVFVALTALGLATMFRSPVGGLLAVLRRLPAQRAN
jgi:O-antigen/teichoic acid export membrane protein